jgi:hypothetical protein
MATLIVVQQQLDKQRQKQQRHMLSVHQIKGLLAWLRGTPAQ